MVIYLGTDHRGFDLKERLKAALQGGGYEVADMGAIQLTPDDDAVDYAKLVAARVSEAASSARGVLFCGSGAAMDIVANKFPNVRSALAISPDHVYQVRHDDDVNVLSIAADFTDEATLQKMVKVFLTTPFAKEEKYERRLEKIAVIEANLK